MRSFYSDDHKRCKKECAENNVKETVGQWAESRRNEVSCTFTFEMLLSYADGVICSPIRQGALSPQKSRVFFTELRVVPRHLSSLGLCLSQGIFLFFAD